MIKRIRKLCRLILKFGAYGLVGITFLLFGFSAYLMWFQPPFYYPRPTGKYAVGTTEYHLVDKNRKETLHHDPLHPNRELMVKVWYPSEHTLQKKPFVPYAPYLVEHLKKTQPLTYFLGCPRSLYSYAQPNLDCSQMRCPIIIYSHGAGGTKESGTAQCEELASHGYIVVGISHTYNSFVVQFPDRRKIDGKKFMEEREGGKNFIETRKLVSQEVEVWVSDVQFVLDELEKMTDDKKSLFYERLDLDKIAMFGQSQGGGVAVQVCRRDPRVKAGVDLDGGLLGAEETNPTGAVSKPLMFILAGETTKMFERMAKDDWKKLNITSATEEKMGRARYLGGIENISTSSKSDIYTFIFHGAGHTDLTDMAFLKYASPLAKPLLKLGILKNPGGDKLTPDTSFDRFRAVEIVRSYLLVFF